MCVAEGEGPGQDLESMIQSLGFSSIQGQCSNIDLMYSSHGWVDARTSEMRRKVKGMGVNATIVKGSVVADVVMYHPVITLQCCLATRCDYIRQYNIQHITA